MFTYQPKYYPATMHNIAKALAEVEYPITKEALIAQVGAKQVKLDFDLTVVFSEILEKMPLDRYTCAAELINNITLVRW